MEYEIVGSNLQLAILQLNGGETVYAEAGAMNHMTSSTSGNVRGRRGR
jgi:uncharacterized protein (AIM24 family)